jgi:carbamoyltransferase
LKLIRELHFPHSIGLLYSAVTQYCGFKVNSGEYKLMGLAPYGRHGHERVAFYVSQIKTFICRVYDDGSIWLDQKYFAYTTGLEMVNRHLWEELFGFPLRPSEATLTQEYCDLALAIQEVTEDIVIKMAQTAKRLTGERCLCLAGGVALNCVANAALKRAGVFEDIWIQPAAGDAGGALGAALAYYFSHDASTRRLNPQDSMQGSYLGPAFEDLTIKATLDELKVSYQYVPKSSVLVAQVAAEIAEGKIIGWFQGRMEFGPRALGGRSILADPRSPQMQRKLNLKIKFREGFRPFAPSVLAEDLGDYFEGAYLSPYMLLVDRVKPEHRVAWPPDYQDWPLDQRLYFVRSTMPAITHLDYTARVQSVHAETNPLYHELISAFKELTGVGMLVNTSFNVRGEPIVGSPMDALKCFFQTDMDILCMGSFLIEKSSQSPKTTDYFRSLQSAFGLD